MIAIILTTKWLKGRRMADSVVLLAEIVIGATKVYIYQTIALQSAAKIIRPAYEEDVHPLLTAMDGGSSCATCKLCG
ncbi:MAG: hypothetical protein EOO03_06440 [Chitinophagaceae bacterium]|nr:MAG: hypothetical protein EOO03_06440 [Chitinophagaceae bacterium]